MYFLNTDLFFLPGTSNRFVHLATLANAFQEFMCFVDVHSEQFYIEEITGGHLEQIKDESLFKDLENYVSEYNILRLRPWNILKNLQDTKKSQIS